MALLDDIVRRVRESFAGLDRDEARDLLLEARIHDGTFAEPRLQRCALVASKGSLATLRYYVKLLAVDYRDVVVAGEYEPVGAKLVRVRDLSRPFEVLLRFPGAVAHNAAVDAWFDNRPSQLGAIAREWFGRMRDCGSDVRELLHDGHPTACVGDAAFAYTNAFTGHVNVGFFRGAALPDPARLLQGDGKYMRHVKLKPGATVDAPSLRALITVAYLDIKRRLGAV